MKRASYINLWLVCTALAVHADIFGFSVVSTNAPNRQAIAEQLFMEATTLSATTASLIFTNAGPLQSSVAGIYFGTDLTTLNLSIDSLTSCSDGVSFEVNSGTPKPPEYKNFSNWWSVTVAVADADNPAPRKGINPYECLDMGLSFNSTSTLSELLESGELQVAIHVIDIGEYSDTFVSIPEPASLVLIGSVSSLFGFARRRFAM